MRYKAIDCYEIEEEVIFESDDYVECCYACDERIEDTDGECNLYILDTETGIHYCVEN